MTRIALVATLAAFALAAPAAPAVAEIKNVQISSITDGMSNTIHVGGIIGHPARHRR